MIFYQFRGANIRTATILLLDKSQFYDAPSGARGTGPNAGAAKNAGLGSIAPRCFYNNAMPSAAPRTEQFDVRAGGRFWRRKSRGILRWKRRHSQARSKGAGDHPVHAQSRFCFMFVGKDFHQGFEGAFRRSIRTPVRSAAVAFLGEREYDRSIISLCEQWQARLQKKKHTVNINLENARPDHRIVCFERREFADDGGIDHQTVETPELFLDMCSDG